MDKAEFELIAKSVQAASDERRAAAVLAYAFDEPPGGKSKDRRWMEFAAAAALLHTIKEAAPDKATRESLLQAAAKNILADFLPIIAPEEAEAFIKAAAELLASVPTPETLTAGSIKKKRTHDTKGGKRPAENTHCTQRRTGSNCSRYSRKKPGQRSCRVCRTKGRTCTHSAAAYSV